MVGSLMQSFGGSGRVGLGLPVRRKPMNFKLRIFFVFLARIGFKLRSDFDVTMFMSSVRLNWIVVSYGFVKRAGPCPTLERFLLKYPYY